MVVTITAFKLETFVTKTLFVNDLDNVHDLFSHGVLYINVKSD